ncbi:hypothetical protein [Orientia tsutsugamushi]|nr:hypothetical protein [Orientia tsutsugamushi]
MKTIKIINVKVTLVKLYRLIVTRCKRIIATPKQDSPNIKIRLFIMGI